MEANHSHDQEEDLVSATRDRGLELVVGALRSTKQTTTMDYPISDRAYDSTKIPHKAGKITKSKKQRKSLTTRPKRPLSAYNLFFQHYRTAFLKTGGEVGFRGHVAKKVADKWSRLDESEKKMFEARAAADKRRFCAEIAVWKKHKGDPETSSAPTQRLGNGPQADENELSIALKTEANSKALEGMTTPDQGPAIRQFADKVSSAASRRHETPNEAVSLPRSFHSSGGNDHSRKQKESTLSRLGTGSSVDDPLQQLAMAASFSRSQEEDLLAENGSRDRASALDVSASPSPTEDSSAEPSISDCAVPAKTVPKSRRRPWKWKKPKSKPKRPLSAYNLFFQHERAKIVKATGSPTNSKSNGVGFAGLARKVADKWKTLKKSEKEGFEAQAAIEKRKYFADLAVWKQKQKQGEDPSPSATSDQPLGDEPQTDEKESKVVPPSTESSSVDPSIVPSSLDRCGPAKTLHKAGKSTKTTREYCSKTKPKGPMTAYNFFYKHERAKAIKAVASSDHRVWFAELGKKVADKWRRLDESERKVFEAKAAADKCRYRIELAAWKNKQEEPSPSASTHPIEAESEDVEEENLEEPSPSASTQPIEAEPPVVENESIALGAQSVSNALRSLAAHSRMAAHAQMAAQVQLAAQSQIAAQSQMAAVQQYNRIISSLAPMSTETHNLFGGETVLLPTQSGVLVNGSLLPAEEIMGLAANTQIGTSISHPYMTAFDTNEINANNIALLLERGGGSIANNWPLGGGALQSHHFEDHVNDALTTANAMNQLTALQNMNRLTGTNEGTADSYQGLNESRDISLYRNGEQKFSRSVEAAATTQNSTRNNALLCDARPDGCLSSPICIDDDRELA